MVSHTGMSATITQSRINGPRACQFGNASPSRLTSRYETYLPYGRGWSLARRSSVVRAGTQRDQIKDRLVKSDKSVEARQARLRSKVCMRCPASSPQPAMRNCGTSRQLGRDPSGASATKAPRDRRCTGVRAIARGRIAHDLAHRPTILSLEGGNGSRSHAPARFRALNV